MPNPRESSDVVMRRSLALLRRLQQGPATKGELLRAIEAAEPGSYGEIEGRACDKRFEADKRRLVEVFGLELRYHKATGYYEIATVWTPLLDLADEDLAVIAFLQETFTPSTPNYEAVQSFLSTLVSYLGPERRGDLDRQRQMLDVAWGQRDADTLAAEVEDKLRKALVERRLVAFDYVSPAYPDGLPRRHIVEPWERVFDSYRGHYYLRGYCREIREPDGHRDAPQKYIHYRLGRISKVTVLPDKLPPHPPRAPKMPLVYRLAPEIARRGDVTRHPGITIERTEAQADGGMLVYATTDNVWWAVRTLLHYGAACEILGGPEALAEIRQIARNLANLYGLRGNSE